MVCSQIFWILDWIPFLPGASLIKLGVATWILIPQNEGERVIYMIFQNYFTQFEQKVTEVRFFYLFYLLKGVLKLALFFTEYCVKRVSPDKLPEFQMITAQADLTLLR